MDKTKDKDKTNAQRQKRYRQRRKNETAVVSADQKARAEKLLQAEEAARIAGADTEALWAAFEAGLAVRLFVEIAQGLSTGEAQLIEWLESEPPGRWMFAAYLTDRGTWGQFESWASGAAPGVLAL